MTISIYSLSRYRTWFFILVLGVTCILFVFVGDVRAAQVPPQIFTYQGRLTDSGGSLLGGAGTTYYFKFSVWDNPTVGSGSRVWPSATPTSIGTTVKQGVFTINIGDTANGYPDALNLDFSSSSNFYLQVEASSNNSTFETLSPRQQITSVAFARIAEAIVGTTTSSVFGTTTPATNSFVTIAATSSNSIPLSIVGALNQAANLFQIKSSTDTNLFSVSAAGGVTAVAATTTSFFSTTASSTNLFTSNFSIGSLTGFLKATAGVVATALVDLASDITGILAVGNGGTGTGTYTTGDILYSDATNSLAKLPIGTPGYVLSSSNGAPSWVATTTLSTISGILNIAKGGTGTSTAPSYGQLLLGNASGGYDLAATSTLGISGVSTFLGLSDTDQSSFTANRIVHTNSGATGLTDTAGFVFNGTNLGIGTTSPYAKLSVVGETVSAYFTATTTATSTFAGGIQTNLLNITSTTATSTFANGIQLSNGCFRLADGNCAGAGALLAINNLSDLNNVATARTNLGLVAGGAGDIWVEKAGDTMTGALTVANVANALNSGNYTLQMLSGVADGASAVAHVFNTSTSLDTSGAKIFDVRNNGNSQLSVESRGSYQGKTLVIRDPHGFANNSNRLYQQILKNSGAIALEIGSTSASPYNTEIRFKDSDNTRIGFPVSDPTYFAFINDSTEMWLGNAGDPTLYFNYYVGTGVNFGTASNLQTFNVNGTATFSGGRVNLAAGTTTYMPLRFTSGPLKTAAEAGAVEFLTDKFYGTITTGAARKEFTLNDSALTSGRVPFATTNGRLTDNTNFFWDNTNARLGIGTTSPYAKLSVVGEVVGSHFTATSTTATSTFSGNFNVAGNTSLGNTTTGRTWVYGRGGSGLDNAFKVTVPVGGGYGFGHTDGTVTLGTYSDGTAGWMGTNSNHRFSLYSNDGGEALTVGVGGSADNIGISTTSPYARLSVTNTSANPSFIVEDSTSPDTTPFIIDASGNVGIGTTSPYAKLSVVGETVSAYFTATSTSATSTFMGAVGVGTASPQYALDVLASGTGVIARFNNANSTGCTLADGGTITCSSDERLKKNITTLNGGISSILRLNPVAYNWNYEDDELAKNIGFIAQEVEPIFPQLVRTDADGFKQLNTIGLIPVLTKAIQEVASIGGVFKTNIIAWLADVANGITDFFAHRVHTQQLCLTDSAGETCITKAQLDALLGVVLSANTSTASPFITTTDIATTPVATTTTDTASTTKMTTPTIETTTTTTSDTEEQTDSPQEIDDTTPPVDDTALTDTPTETTIETTEPTLEPVHEPAPVSEFVPTQNIE